MRKTPKPLAELSPKIRKKVVLRPEHETEERACWIWVGTFLAAKRRYREYQVAPDEERFRASTGCLVNERGMPRMHSSEYGYSIPAARVVYAEAYELNVRDVNRLTRCGDERCVNPHHHVDTGRLARPASAWEVPQPPKPQPPKKPVLDLLREKMPFHGMDANTACEEMNIPPDSIPPEDWAVYVAEEMAKEAQD